MLNTIFILAVLFQFKHFISDYPLQSKYMLNKFKEYPYFICPLLAHAATHSLLTFIIACLFSNNLIISLALMFFDLIAHFIIDRIKASPNLLGKFKPEDKFFWWSLGADQMFHHLTHYFIIYILVAFLD